MSPTTLDLLEASWCTYNDIQILCKAYNYLDDLEISPVPSPARLLIAHYALALLPLISAS